MLFRLFAFALLVVTPVLGCAHDGVSPSFAGETTHTIISSSNFPSRIAQEDANGFYFQPSGLAEDYPEESTTQERIRADIQLLSDVHARYLRVGIGWDGIEQTPGRYSWGYWDDLIRIAVQNGITVLPYVCYSPKWSNDDPKDFWRKPPKDPSRFASFMYEIARRYAGKVQSWELWNEPDIENYWLGTPEEFAVMVRDGALAVRRADPSARIVLGGMAQGRTPFLEKLLREFKLGPFFDAINVHGYLETWEQLPAESYPDRLHRIQGLMIETAPKADLWLAEFGYSDYRMNDREVSPWVEAVYDYEHTPQYQGVSLWKHHVLATASQALSLSTWYRIHDLPPGEEVIGDANNRHLGIVDVKGKKKPAFAALKLFNHLFDQPTRLLHANIEITRPARSESVLKVFENADGSFLVTGWLRSSLPSEVPNKSGRARDKRRETIAVKLPLAPHHDWELMIHNLPPEQPNGKTRLDENWLKEIYLRGDRVFIAELRPKK
ncbi:MAG: hypothetical protein A2428_09075 [Bdellovibrionales bacterium RIFOXYC1_FULL_54_43]|nr:MAG: hypothetical protein A2428_09075 [Bdellovibrionales bacterium RIFOXYC1_FULL_54_43]OFZ78460.1 MAG: hypothetical protein A2603_04405 [Bdellovibrionales bacterium RIFOXYD1_FULL_55_31]